MTRTVERFLFEGELRTVKEIQMQVPCLAEWSIRNLLSKGLNTKMAMLSYKAPTNKSPETRKRIRSYGEKWYPK